MIFTIYRSDIFCVLFLSMSMASLPALEWMLPSSTEQYELRIEVQPRQHHRAHYETEGSRGAVKAASGGHPVVQVQRERVVWVGVSLTYIQTVGLYEGVKSVSKRLGGKLKV